MSEVNTPNRLNEQSIPVGELPSPVSEFLHIELRDFTGKSELPRQLSVIHFEGVDTYVMPIPPSPDAQGYQKGDTIILADAAPDGQVSGYGILGKILGEVPESQQQPYVAHTKTKLHYQRQGLGLRRLKLMNEVSRQRYGEVLYSDRDGDTSLEAAAVWGKLVVQELAETYDQDGVQRWRFKQ